MAVLVIDDEEKLRNLMSKIISIEGFEVLQAKDIKSGLKLIDANDFDVIVCDVKLPDGSGVDAVKLIKEKNPLSEVILLTAYGNIPDGVQAIKNGAFDYITKGDDNNKIIPLIYKASEKVKLARKKINISHKSSFSFENIIGKSSAISQAIALAQKVAKTQTTVLLTGETGTGKEVFAQAIHQASSRSNENFVAINCSAFSKDLLENELFGHKAGAYTGADKEHKGLFEVANRGTIFLDEIGEMPIELQAKILRVLEAGEFLKIGDTQPTKVDVRVIAATNRDLNLEIEKGNFRSDLFYRLSVFSIKLPSLNERKKDIPALVKYYVDFFALKNEMAIPEISQTYIEALENYDWKGNVRELRNIVERSLILAENNLLSQDTLPYNILQTTGNEKQLSAFSMANAEKLHIQKILNYTKGNKAEAARLLEIGIATLYRKIDEYRL
ncbi:sigma-54-dependent Fis family transcriptional regulator [Ornithobacterium rhinotracheale]|uniref:sigma-54-dependent transcriptional regulator n=1 Tax=Ornithobacterium rhinotracheale TaxID=28251 RepID=UPI00129C8D28|nr:sigma-54 dependent transcriptional regulator [Ornithobacterium rhinotracheale]MRI62642.1 sigma-54-dependent Fis family transcriptional regulator [Ornithobacterium rhinotracheale]MRJ10663.1 sigma-54-dependent Fis family transcriptional regulator [Ornithobacterium rhinotracheale]